MARTGSGKTAAYVLPMLEKLKAHSLKFGCRGLVIVPTRELAIQILQVVKEFMQYSDLKCALLVGGELIEEQFAAILSNPDVIVGTPGRILHLIGEMKNFSLSSVEYFVLDEADRLFEMGIETQIKELIELLPKDRQSCFLSATMPMSLVDFAKSGLVDPTLIRLDSDCKISQDLDFFFFNVKHEQKEAVLLFLLQNVIEYENQLSIIFCSTKHHVEYLCELLRSCGIETNGVYGTMDQTARSNAIDLFRKGKIRVLVVTDVASRGLDIPMLDNVINYDFPDKAKLFIHRTGRAGRAGRHGNAYSLLISEEIPYLVDFQLFIGKPLVFSSVLQESEGREINYRDNLVLGDVPNDLLSTSIELIRNRMELVGDLESLKRVCENGYKMFVKTKTAASAESHKRSKELLECTPIEIHPLLVKMYASAAGKLGDSQLVKQKLSLLSSIKGYKPSQTIFESGKKGPSNDSARQILGKRRTQLDHVIDAKKKSIAEARNAIASKSFKDVSFYMDYQKKGESADAANCDKAFSFVQKAKDAILDVIDDENVAQVLRHKKWDKQKSKFVQLRDHSEYQATKKNLQAKKNKLSKEAPKGLFDKWQKKTGMSLPKAGQDEISADKLNHLNLNKKEDYRRFSKKGKKPKTTSKSS